MGKRYETERRPLFTMRSVVEPKVLPVLVVVVVTRKWGARKAPSPFDRGSGITAPNGPKRGARIKLPTTFMTAAMFRLTGSSSPHKRPLLACGSSNSLQEVRWVKSVRGVPRGSQTCIHTVHERAPFRGRTVSRTTSRLTTLDTAP